MNPWHLQFSRWAHEATVTPLLVLLPLTLLAAAGIIPIGATLRPRPTLALVAGVVCGVCCYGYPAVRIFLPAFIAVTVLVGRAGWRQALAERQGRAAALLLLAGLTATLGPLAWLVIYPLIGLHYPPAEWLADQREIAYGPLKGDKYINGFTFRSYGKLTFLVDQEALDRLNRLASNGRPDRVAVIVRPGEIDSRLLGEPAARVLWPDGRVSLLLYTIQL